MDIRSGGENLAKNLTNFKPRTFLFDGVLCHSLEGALQAFKFDKPHIQVEVCKLVGLAAKRRGQKRNKAWKRVQTLWWKGVAYDRHGPEYQGLLDRLFEAVAKTESFKRDLLATGDAPLTHSIGKHNPRETVLTEAEFCSRLMKLRDRLRREAAAGAR